MLVGGERDDPRDWGTRPGAGQVVLSPSFSTRPEEDLSDCRPVDH